MIDLPASTPPSVLPLPGTVGAHSALRRIGNTPLIELTHMSPKPGVRIFAKFEGTNPTGSIKDRVARALVCELEREGRLHPGQRIVEASSGNTAISLAMVARQRGYKVCVVLPEGVPPMIADTLMLFDVHLHWCKPLAGMRGAIEAAEQLAKDCGGVALRQFQNPLNVHVHETQTGEEIVRDLPEVDVFVAGIGTGGTITGVARRLRRHNPKVRIVGVEPHMGERLQGLTCLEDHFAAPLFDISLLDRRFLVTAARSLQLMREITAREGLVAGVSSGAALHAALREAERMDSGNIVVMFSDSGWKYLPSRPWDAAERDDPNLDEVHWW